MSVTKHIPDTSPEPTGTSCPGYPHGVWPPVLSAFCADPSPANPRHPDCSLPGCICSCHTKPRYAGRVENLEQERKAKDNAIDESKQEEEKLGQGIEQLNRLERLGSNLDQQQSPFPETAFDLSVGWRRDLVPARSKKGRPGDDLNGRCVSLRHTTRKNPNARDR